MFCGCCDKIKYIYVRRDLMDILRPAWMNSDMQKAMEFISKCTSDRQLCRAAAESPYLEVRVIAAERITSPDALVKAAGGTSEPVILKKLSERTSDDAVRGRMVCATTLEGAVTDEIYSSIKDEKVLYDITCAGKYLSSAPERISDRELLSSLARILLALDTEEAYSAGAKCAEKSGERDTIYRYAMKADSLERWYVCREAFTELLKDPGYNRELSVHLRQLEIRKARENIEMAVGKNA